MQNLALRQNSNRDGSWFGLSDPRERTRATLETARVQGQVRGRRPKLSPRQQAELVRGVQEERCSMSEAARLFQVHPATVSRLMAQQLRR
ncbi:hypothetical protein [Deinococcus altitudinis]|uniref:hypothetical protein n=1 Tax=Deinococcus altitudinis TaxID=468914 RepID=UPI0038916465